MKLHLAKGPPGLLVGEDVLQSHHLGRELGEVLLGLVNHRQPLAQIGQGFALFFLPLLQAVADLFGKGAQAIVQGARQGPFLLAQALNGLTLK